MAAPSVPLYRILFGPGPFPTAGQLEQTGPVAVPATITGTWDAYRATIGRTVPANIERARAATRAIPGRAR